MIMNNAENSIWIMFKKEWLDAAEKLPLETFARFIQCLRTGELTEDVFANVLVQSHITEFNRVNEFTKKARENRKDKSKKAAAARWHKEDNPKQCLSIPQAMPKECHTSISISTDTNTNKNINKSHKNYKYNSNLGIIGFNSSEKVYSNFYTDTLVSEVLKQKILNSEY